MFNLIFKDTKPQLHGALAFILIAVMGFNQYMIGILAEKFGSRHVMKAVVTLLTPKAASAKTIVMPLLNDDGRTTYLGKMPTITDVSGEPLTGTPVERALTVMMAKGAPFYATDNISFDDPVAALSGWGKHENDALDPTSEERYKQLIKILTCNFCCGSPTSVTINGNCGCNHARAARGFFRYMLAKYADKYSNDELIGEAYRWQAVWYPSGVVEDYLLATGRGSAVGHKTHGGAGTDGMHGVK